MLTPSQILAYHRDGYVVAPQVFADVEVAAFRRAVEKSRDPGGKDIHLFNVDELRDLWRDPRLLSIARDLVGDPLVFFCEANYTSFRFSATEHIEGRHLHHDAKGVPEHIFNRLHEPQTATYPVVRFGIYLQDYSVQSGGLKVSPGSHRIDTSSMENANLPYINLRTRPGDIVCFTLRVLHSPFAMRLIEDPGRGLSPREEDILFVQRPDLFLPSPPERDTIFVDYACEDADADLQIKSRALNPAHLKSRGGFVEALLNYDIEAAAQSAGVTLRLDYGVVDIACKLSKLVGKDGDLPATALPYLTALARFYRNSLGLTPYFNLFDEVVGDISPEAGMRLLNNILPRILKYQSTFNTRAPDNHMGAAKLSSLRKLLEQPTP